MKKNSKYRQGIFVPTNQDKFIGERAVYRSGLELKFFRFCDDNKNVLKWSSEDIVVPYISPVDGRMHRYFVDNFIVIKEVVDPELAGFIETAITIRLILDIYVPYPGQYLEQ